MYLKKNKGWLFFIAVAALLWGCQKTTWDESNQQTSYSEYYSLQVGKSYLYRLDSLVLLSFGSDTVTHTYLQKDSVMSVGTDLTGAITYTVNSYIKSYTGDDDWQYLTQYQVTPKSSTLEMVDANNLRFIKLASPVTEGYTWNGNGYFIQGNGENISTDSSLYKYLNWNYQYGTVGGTVTFSSGTFDNALTVSEIDKESGTLNYKDYYQRQFAEESYAKGQGLVHRKFLFLTYQQNVGFESISYGVELTRIP